MSDIRKALEAAAEVTCGFLYGKGPCDCADGVCDDDRSQAIARAAVLGFLKSLPEETAGHLPPDTRDSTRLSYVVPNTPSRLAAAIQDLLENEEADL